MPPPLFGLGRAISTVVSAPARICLRPGYKKIGLPPGRYRIMEIWRDKDYWHCQELSDGYTYRLSCINRHNPYFGKRISIWQNDLADALSNEGP